MHIYFITIALFYYTLGNISPKYRSSLQSIQLLIAVKSNLLVRYGADKILKPVLAEIKQLESVRDLCIVYVVIRSYSCMYVYHNLHHLPLLTCIRKMELPFLLEDLSITFEAQSPFSQLITLQASMWEAIKH